MLLIEPWHICHLATGLLCVYKYVVEEVNKDTVREARGIPKKKYQHPGCIPHICEVMASPLNQ
jgi:hypothetical protein